MPYMNNSQPSWEHVELEENSKSISVSTPRSSKSRKKIEFINELETSGNLGKIFEYNSTCSTIGYNYTPFHWRSAFDLTICVGDR